MNSKTLGTTSKSIKKADKQRNGGLYVGWNITHQGKWGPELQGSRRLHLRNLKLSEKKQATE